MLIEKNDFKVDTSNKIDYNKLKPVISVSLLNGTLPLQTKKVHSVYRMKNIETGNELSKDWEVHLIELGKKVSSENENLKLWIQFFSSKNLEADKMDIIEKNPYFEEVFERYKNFSGDTELMEKYRDIQAYKMYQMDFMNEEKMLSRQEGFEEGQKEGLEEGQKIAMRKIANNMLSLGESIEKVKTITGLTEEEIRIINN